MFTPDPGMTLVIGGFGNKNWDLHLVILEEQRPVCGPPREGLVIDTYGANLQELWCEECLRSTEAKEVLHKNRETMESVYGEGA